MILQSQKISNTELAAEEYAFSRLERENPGILTGVEQDLQAGLGPARIESIWLRCTGQEQMAKTVGMAARHIERSGEIKQ